MTLSLTMTSLSMKFVERWAGHPQPATSSTRKSFHWPSCSLTSSLIFSTSESRPSDTVLSRIVNNTVNIDIDNIIVNDIGCSILKASRLLDIQTCRAARSSKFLGCSMSKRFGTLDIQSLRDARYSKFWSRPESRRCSFCEVWRPASLGDGGGGEGGEVHLFPGEGLPQENL